MKTSKRIVWMDITRVLAIIFVVLCHAIESDYYAVRMTGKPVSDLCWAFENISFTFGRLGVPLFLMLSGALMLGREYDTKTFYKRSLIPLFITTEIWNIINYFYYIYNFSYDFDWEVLLYDVLFWRNPYASHMWYMPVILGIYLVLPLLAKAFRNTPFSSVFVPMVVGFFGGSVASCFNAFAAIEGSNLYGIRFMVDTAFYGGIYGLMFVLGYYIVNADFFKKIPTFAYIITAVVSFGANSMCARYLYVNQLYDNDIFGWYHSPFIIISATCLFALLSRIKAQTCPKIITILSSGSFAIYLTHNIVLKFFEKHFSFHTGFDITIRSFILFAVALSVPAVLVLILNALPLKRFKKLVFYMK